MVVAAAFCQWIVTAVGINPPLASRVFSGFPGGELLRRTLAMCPETCKCGAMMVIRDDVIDADEIAATMTRLGLCSTPPPLGRSLKYSGEVQ